MVGNPNMQHLSAYFRTDYYYFTFEIYKTILKTFGEKSFLRILS